MIEDEIASAPGGRLADNDCGETVKATWFVAASDGVSAIGLAGAHRRRELL